MATRLPDILMVSPKGSRFWRVAIGAVLGGAALAATLYDVDQQALLAAVAAVDPILAGASLVSSLAAVGVIAVRWRILFRPDYADLPLAALFRAVTIGQMLNIVLPIRLGEVARLHGISTSYLVPAGRVLATLAIEKTLEVAVFTASAISLLVLVAMPADVVSPRAAWLIVPAVAGAMSILTARYGPSLARRVARSRRVPRSLRRRLVDFSDSFAAGIVNAASPGRGTSVVGLSLLIVLLPALANQLLLYAFGLDLPVWAGLALLVVLQVGSVPPSLPGRLGIFNYLTVVTLQWLGVDRVTAASYSIALYAIAYVPKLVLGGLFVALPAPRAVAVPAEHIPS